MAGAYEQVKKEGENHLGLNNRNNCAEVSTLNDISPVQLFLKHKWFQFGRRARAECARSLIQCVCAYTCRGAAEQRALNLITPWLDVLDGS